MTRLICFKQVGLVFIYLPKPETAQVYTLLAIPDNIYALGQRCAICIFGCKRDPRSCADWCYNLFALCGWIKKEGVLTVADSNITKRALASALKELMEDVPFEKINVAHICEKCGMNRKSFYYHFKDKYDLVNWIFDTDFIALTVKRPDDRWEFFQIVCDYFFENRNFYRRALRVKGQNSFPEHFREFLHPLIRIRLEEIMGQRDIPHICIDFFTDGLVCTLERWLLDKNCMPPEQFVAILKTMLQGAAMEIYQDMNCPSPGHADENHT